MLESIEDITVGEGYNRPSKSRAERNKANLKKAMNADITWLQSRLYVTGRKFGLDHNSTEDAIQDFYVNLFTRIVYGFDGTIPRDFSFSVESPERNKFMTYALTSFVNLTKDYHRMHKRRAKEVLETEVSRGYEEDGERFILDLEDSQISEASITLTSEETRNSMEKYLMKLPGHLREIIALAYYQKYTYSQISSFLDIPVGTVKSRLHNAMLSLAEIVEKDKGSANLKDQQKA